MSDRPHIRLSIVLRPWSARGEGSVELVLPIDEVLSREALAPMDLPSLDCLLSEDVVVRNVFCTPPAEIRRRLLSRRELHDALLDHLSARIHEELGRHDTVMGYKKEDL